MKRIALLSDTHSHLDESIISHIEECDEIWHAGDIGNEEVIHTLEALKPVRAVHGNIDHGEVKLNYPVNNRFNVDGLDVLITHIGGYPKKYNKRVHEIFNIDPPQLFICGHSHICKVMFDKQFNFLHMNPGAAGHHGFHKIRTMLRFSIVEGIIKDLQVIELGIRGNSVKTNRN